MENDMNTSLTDSQLIDAYMPPFDVERFKRESNGGVLLYSSADVAFALRAALAGEREPPDVRIYWHAYHGWMAEWLPVDNAKKPNGGQNNYFVVHPAAQPAALVNKEQS
jgi:hypothetical protein